jgi:hypothetical protein
VPRRAPAAFNPGPHKGGSDRSRPEGVNDPAFILEAVLEALTHLRGQQWVIYGGDFDGQAANGRWRPTYENWYVQHQPSEPTPAFIERSIDATAGAISKVQTRRGEGVAPERVVLTAARPRT